ncbi:MAG: liaS [Adhaeribacter sp.]|nr:liaS [Adhaeribacter sp.]
MPLTYLKFAEYFILSFILLNIISLTFYQSLLPASFQYAFSAILGVISIVLIWNMFAKRNRLVAAVLHLKGLLPDFKHSLMLTELGVLLEVLCFTAGLSYKSLLAEQERNVSQQKLLQQMQENEKLKENLAQMKATISRELQEDMAATLTGISVYSYIETKI